MSDKDRHECKLHAHGNCKQGKEGTTVRDSTYLTVLEGGKGVDINSGISPSL
jgi:hypothetical protein